MTTDWQLDHPGVVQHSEVRLPGRHLPLQRVRRHGLHGQGYGTRDGSRDELVG